MPITPWKIIESNYLSPMIRVDKCELPTGFLLDVTIAEHRTWANVLAITKDQKAVLVKQYRHGVKDVLLELPGGIVEDGEYPLDGIKRELLEETGYAVSNIIEVGRLYPNPANQTNLLYCFLAFDAEQVGVQHLFVGEEIEVQLVPLDELITMAKNGQFLHALHVAVLFQAFAHMNRLA
jgi:ADP-ribose pyrophosphatase